LPEPDDYSASAMDTRVDEDFESMELADETVREGVKSVPAIENSNKSNDLQNVYDLLLKILKILEDQAKYDLNKVKHKN
jgi:hypothetical protein